MYVHLRQIDAVQSDREVWEENILWAMFQKIRKIYRNSKILPGRDIMTKT
jgi:hypothetical protein